MAILFERDYVTQRGINHIIKVRKRRDDRAFTDFSPVVEITGFSPG